MTGLIPKITKLKQAVILAGGEGKRLRPLTNNQPKPMIKIHGRPYLEYLIEYLRDQNIEEILLLVGYKAHKILEHFGNGKKYGIKITYSVGGNGEEELTGSRIRNASKLLDNIFLLLYCDNICPLIISELEDNFYRLNKLATTTVYTNKDGLAEYGKENNICVGNNKIVRFYDKKRANPNSNGVDMGFFIINKKIISLMPDYDFSFEIDLLPKLIERQELGAFMNNKRYYFLTSPKTKIQVEKYLNPQKLVLLDSSITNNNLNYSPVEILKKLGIRTMTITNPTYKLLIQMAKEHYINFFKTHLITLNAEHSLLDKQLGCTTHVIQPNMLNNKSITNLSQHIK